MATIVIFPRFGKQIRAKVPQWPLVTTVNQRHAAVAGSFEKGSDSSQEEYEKALPFSSLPGPRGVPWFGKWFAYKRDISKVYRRDLVLKEFYNKYGYIVRETVAGRDIVHLFHPDFIKQIYETEGRYPAVPPLLEAVKTYRQRKDLAPGLGNSNGEEWYRLRKVVQHIMLRPYKALDYLRLQNKVATDFVDKFESLISENGEIPDFNRWMARWGIESAAHNCFEMRMGYLEDKGAETANKIIDANSKVFDISVKLFFSLPIYKLLPTPGIKKLYDCEDFINGLAFELMGMASKQYRQAVEENSLTGDQFMFLSYLLGSKDVSERDIMPVILSVLTDTLSTTSQIALFNLYSLATNPEAQEKAHDEALQLLSPSGELTAEAFNSCVYIKACIKESFRLLPVGLDILRLSPSNMVIGGYQVPEGTFLCLNNYCYALDPRVIPDPEVYSPERWLREDASKEKTHPYMLTPFSLGRRMCAGRRFAEQELVLLLSKILARYRLEWHYGKLHQHFRLLCVPDQEVKIKFIPR
ncbi:hypothetical protein BsWGS_13702 [Bradybaena similaris]